ncbi:TatD family hydrolase [Pseudocolwellia agarivorans]|uniref:TatD family hydrolase n=1 Tax=Pseudocolwellia agarivorans TaxID=1911682 RepID=UPI00098605BB|nr:TatD family hydrolase [Pseudocolwellia agarivorans]
MIDIGVNLTNSRFEKDVDEVISQANACGVKHLLVTGTNVFESQKALELCLKYPQSLSCTVGVHPHDADNVANNYLEVLQSLASLPSVKAIGECGLDFNRNFSTPTNQKKVFTEQVKLAQHLQLPLFLHQRDAFKEWFEILTPYFTHVPFMVSHCFTGTEEELNLCLEANMYIGITGWICDERRGQGLRDIIEKIPLNRLLIETDAPYLTPRTIRPKPKSSRNEPKYLRYVVEEIARLTDYSEQDIINNTSENAQRVFGLGVKA